MSQAVLYQCPHTATVTSHPPSFDPGVANFHYHPLEALLFCEECDGIRCDRCVECEVSYYFCPNCLFEVPGASVRAERNRCARNCFLCPQCDHTLSVVASDPQGLAAQDLKAPAASIGEPPYYLSCSFCRWDSKEAGVVFEKPTGLATQLQKLDDEAPELLELDRLKDHFEPFLKVQLMQHTTGPSGQTNAPSPAQLAASAALLRDIPALSSSSRYTSVLNSTTNSTRSAGSRSLPHLAALAAADHKDEPSEYQALFPWKDSATDFGRGEDDSLDLLRAGTAPDGSALKLAHVSKRWVDSWQQPMLCKDLRPLRIPLRSKRTKRCPSCKHILIKPEQKAQSTRFKIQLAASNFIPHMDLVRKSAIGSAILGSRLTAAASVSRRGGAKTVAAMKDGEEESLRQGRSYTFELTLTNPFQEPIAVQLALSNPDDSTVSPGYSIALPAPSFSISGVAESWEYEEEVDDDDLEDESGDAKRGRRSLGSVASRRRNAPGIIERKANHTTIAVELVLGKDFLGPLKRNMFVTFSYQTEEGATEKQRGKGATDADEGDKTFAFWTVLSFGTVVPRPGGGGLARQSMASFSFVREPTTA